MKLSEAIQKAEKARKLAGGFPVGGTDETKRLGETLNNLAGSIIKYEEEISSRKEKFSRLVENLNEKYIFFSFAPDGEVTFTSRSVENITGYTQEEFAPSFRAILEKGDLIKKEGYVNIEQALTFEAEFTHKNSHTLFFEITGVPFTDRAGKLIYIDGIIKDKTDEIINEAKLRQTQKMETIGILAGGLAHDFNNLLGGIIGPASLMRYLITESASGNPDSKKIDSYLEMIEESGNKAADIVKQLMTISREQKIMASQVNLLTAVNHVADICRNTFDKSVSISVRCSIENPEVTADKTQLEQVFLNLCVNSYHAMTSMRPREEAWGGCLSIEISSIIPDSYFRKTHPEAENREYYAVSVQDSGIGISKDNITRIFTPFFSTKKDTEGTGLGLTMTYNIIKQHRGFIDVYSEEGKGSAFKIFIPVSGKEDQLADNSIRQSDLKKGKGLILVIDDEEVIRDVAREILQHCGYEVITAGNGREGIEKYRAGSDSISAVLLDMAMPEMSGKETYLMLREINPGVKVVLASGYRNDSRVDEALSLGINSFLEKPYTMGRLSEVIGNVIR